MGHGEAQGKIILFGEHFVVHGAPAIAGGVSSRVLVDVEPSDENRIVTAHKVVEKMSLSGIERILAVMGIHGRYEVRLTGDLRTYGGLGSSAAFCVALVNALADERGLHLTKREINKYAYEGEKAFHGNPSGIDNTIATHGGVIVFRRGRTPDENSFEFVELYKPLDLAVTFTGKYSETSKMVGRVKKFKSQDEVGFKQLMDEYTGIAGNARHALERGKAEDLGSLMNANQALLSELGVSDEGNEKVNKMALDEGALGAKLTGGGGGGCCIALGRDKYHSREIVHKMKNAGFDSFQTKIVKML
ncbi:mevalonate kinase [Candidatus Micrarchaeota archaeon]|nr:mevalonate kinase [Candidatus Micrarchaeota archaeon]